MVFVRYGPLWYLYGMVPCGIWDVISAVTYAPSHVISEALVVFDVCLVSYKAFKSISIWPQGIAKNDKDRLGWHLLSLCNCASAVALCCNKTDSQLLLIVCSSNESAQSNLERRPCRGTVTHARRKVPIGNNGMPQICPQKYPFPWTDPQTPLPASSLDPSDLRCQTASGSDPPFFHNALDRPTHGRTGAQTNRSSTGKFDHYRTLCSESDVT